MRVSGLLLFTPFLGSAAISARVKAGLVVCVTALLYPTCGRVSVDATNLAQAVTAISTEFLVGLVIGLAINFIFDGVQLAGHILGIQMGFSLVNVLDPQSQIESPVLSIFHQTIALLIFLQLEIHHWLLRGLARSFEYLPVGRFVMTGPIAAELWRAASGIWLVGVQIAAPALIATVLTDLVLGFLAKASPQFPVLFVGLSVKSTLGFLATGLALRFWPPLFERYFTSALKLSAYMLRLGA